MSTTRTLPSRATLLTTLAGVLLVAACNYGSGAGGTLTAGTGTPAATATTSGGGGGYGGGGYGGGGGNPTPVPTTASTPGTSGTQIKVATSPTLGTYLTGAGGKTLYTNTYTDSDTTSGCNGACATAWPPLAGGATGGAGASGAIATITRTDGTTQVTYAGHPLYYYSGDSAAGDTNGEGMDNNYWHVAKP